MTLRALAVLAVFATAALVVGSASAFKLQRVARGFTNPVYVTHAPGNLTDLFVVQQRGVITRVHAGKKFLFLDLRDRVSCCGERGLLSIAFHPKFKQNRRFFVDYTNKQGDTRVVGFLANAARTRGRKSTAHAWLAVNQPFANHNGGQLQFGHNGLLYIGMGDGGGGGDPGDRAQSLRSRLGKILSLNVNVRHPKAQIAALGLRNPWRFSVDAKNGIFWIGDVGQGSWEEVDRWDPGSKKLQNFGWNVWEGRHRYHDSRSGNNHITRGALHFPLRVYSHSVGCSITGGYMMRGSVLGAGRYFFGDYCNGKVWSIRFAHGKQSGFRREAFTVPGSLSSFGLGPRGGLLLVSYGGAIYKLAK
jgi:glucose/arabinose dehydrogenase